MPSLYEYYPNNTTTTYGSSCVPDQPVFTFRRLVEAVEDVPAYYEPVDLAELPESSDEEVSLEIELGENMFDIIEEKPIRHKITL